MFESKKGAMREERMGKSSMTSNRGGKGMREDVFLLKREVIQT